MNVLLFGATGNIGSAIAGELVARGHRVTAASRRGGGVDGLDVAVRRADAADPVQVAEAATRQDAIVSAIGPQHGVDDLSLIHIYPSQVLQHAVSGTTLHVLAVAGTVVYFCHFAVPLLVGLVLWLKDRAQYLRFVTALLGMCMVGFVFFMLVPTAPPWYAAQDHVLSGVTDLINSQHTLPSAISPFYSLLNPNSTAAFPSLHAAFPFLCFLALRRVYPRGSWILFGWSCLVFVSVVFLGEHYVIDVIGGVLLASAAWWVMMHAVVPHVTVLRTARPVLEAPAAAVERVGV